MGPDGCSNARQGERGFSVFGLDQLHVGCKWLQKQNYFSLCQYGWLFFLSKVEQFVPDPGGILMRLHHGNRCGCGYPDWVRSEPTAPSAEADASGVKSSP